MCKNPASALIIIPGATKDNDYLMLKNDITY